jgi:hypothetical protein
VFIVLLDEPGLFVYESPAAAADAIEPPDAEKEVRAAFNDDAVPYRVEWIRPNQRRQWFGGRSGSVKFGEYQFVPAGPAEPAALIALLEGHSEYTNPPEANVKLESLLKRLRGLRLARSPKPEA